MVPHFTFLMGLMYYKVCVGVSFCAKQDARLAFRGLEACRDAFSVVFSKLNLLQQSKADETSQSLVMKQYIRCVFSTQNASVTAKAKVKSFSGVSDGQVGTVTRPSVMIRNNKQPLQG